MKKIVFSIAAVIALNFSVNAQAPEGFKYQSVIRNGSNVILNNQAVGMQLIIHQGTPGGAAVYTETFSTTSNAYGLVNLEIGSGTTSDDFSTIDWSAGPYFIETAADLTGGTSYTSMGTSQLMSVPYALYAKGADETDPAFNASVAAGISAADTANWNNDLVDDADADPTNEYNTSAVLNGSTLELTDGGGMLTVDLSSLAGGGSGQWLVNGNNINNANTGSVVVGPNVTNSNINFVVANNTSAKAAIGYIGSFNNVNSGELYFAEDVNYSSGECGIKFQHNGSANNVYMIGACTTPDTIARYNRNAYANIRRLRLGNNINSNSTLPLTVDGDVQINGNITVTGNVAKGGGTFKIDHPMDPANKYLVHSFVESPEMMNVFSGNIVTDANGFATVTMPDYFEAANKDFRYQLTVIGSFAQAIVKEKISNNSFVIQTNQPNIEVSWQVTSVRSDKYANANRVVPVQEKEFKGSYIHPELYGADKSKSEDVVRTKAAELAPKEIGTDGQ